MGGAVSAGVDNDELIDNLLEADYIKSSDVERVFRSVDRGHYFTTEFKERAYRDLAWKFGNLHISAPCIYSRVMENLKLGPGMSFLNLGSGTGYLSTMAGLLLGSNGINHGIEIHEDVLNYSKTKLDEFFLTSSAIDEYEFCEPKFVCGNCLNLGAAARLYDRVYCGAACPEKHESYMKNLIKVGGILVMPINDQLFQIRRTSESKWESKSVLSVSFATLMSDKVNESIEPLKMRMYFDSYWYTHTSSYVPSPYLYRFFVVADTDPLSLQDICRFAIRSILRRSIDVEHPELKRPPRLPRKRVKKRTFHGFFIPIFNTEGEEQRNLTVSERRQYVMDVSSSQTCRSLREFREKVEASAQLFDAIEANFASPPPDFQRYTHLENDEKKELDLMEEDGEFEMPLDGSHENGLEEMSDEEFLSEVEGLHNILMKADSSSSKESPVENENEGGGKRQCCNSSSSSSSSCNERTVTAESNRENMDCEMVEVMEAGGDYESSESELDNDELLDGWNEKKASKNQGAPLKSTDLDIGDGCQDEAKENLKRSSSVDSSPVQVINYTTYMKEKIKSLPLPLPLKYFINLNREL